MNAKIIAAIVMAASAATASADDWTISGENGGSFTVLPKSVRIYRNKFGVTQVDTLVDWSGKSGEFHRSRYAVTGCGSNDGELADVRTDGEPNEKPMNWYIYGTRVYDRLALMICLAGVEKMEADIKKGKRPGV